MDFVETRHALSRRLPTLEEPVKPRLRPRLPIFYLFLFAFHRHNTILYRLFLFFYYYALHITILCIYLCIGF